VKVGDLVTIDKFCAPPGLYGLGIVIEITHQDGGTGEPLRARVHWQGRTGSCAVRYLHKAQAVYEHS
jgi:hypothetical protein